MPDIAAVNGADTNYPTNGLPLGSGATFTIDTPFSTLTIDDNDATFNGDTGTNETPDDPGQTVNIGGTDVAAIYEYTFTATDGTTTYVFAIIDVDLNNDGNVGNGTVAGADPGEQVAFIAVIGPNIPDVPAGGLDLTIVGVVTENSQRPFSDFICFASGTLIETAAGPVPVEDLCPGDLIRTGDNGYKKLNWIGMRDVAAGGSMTPVRIERGALGNTRDLVVSPQHRILLGNAMAELLFGAAEILVPAKALVGKVPNVRFDDSYWTVRYCHLLFDQHELVWSEGILTESFHPGKHSLEVLGHETRDEILTIFPELMETIASYPSVRASVKPWEASVFLDRSLSKGLELDVTWRP
ncbi:MAG: Hint domain-containing protein [Paracoccaceae bacterium]